MENIESVPLPIKKDERGWIIIPPVIEDFGSAHLHIPSLKPKAVRGNHYHQAHTELVMILGGTCLIAARNIETNHYEEFVYDGVVKQLFLIRPGITHAFKNLSYHSIYLICYYQGPKDIPVSSMRDHILT